MASETKGRWRGGPGVSEGAGRGVVAVAPHPTSGPPRLPEAPLLGARPNRENGGCGCLWPPRYSGRREWSYAEVDAWLGRRGVPAAWEAPLGTRSEWTRWAQAPGRTRSPSLARGMREDHTLHRDFSVLQLGNARLAQGHLWTVLLETQGRPNPS